MATNSFEINIIDQWESRYLDAVDQIVHTSDLTRLQVRAFASTAIISLAIGLLLFFVFGVISDVLFGYKVAASILDLIPAASLVTGILYGIYLTTKIRNAYVKKVAYAAELRIEELRRNLARFIRHPEDGLTVNDPVLHEVKAQLVSQFEAFQENEELIRESFQEKADLITYLAHDIKTPLASIIGYLSMLTEVEELSQESREKYTKLVLKSALKLDSLITEFFDVTKFNLAASALNRSEVDLTLLVNQIVEDHYPMAAARELEITVDSKESINIFADVEKLVRAVQNLVKNAVTYADKGTQIICKLEPGETNAKLIVSNAASDLTPAQMERIFKKFYRLDNARSSESAGSGLGLPIAREIIESHGGSLTVDSANHTVSFTMIIPYS